MVNGTHRARERAEEAWSTIVREARDRVAFVGALGSIGLHSGIASRLGARGVVELARARLGGGLGLPSLFRVHAANRPDDLAIVCGGRAFSYGQIHARVERLAARLRDDLGLRRGDAAVLWMHNRAEFLEIQAALTRLGGSAVSASARSTPDEIDHLVQHSGARAVFVDADLEPAATEGRARWPRVAPRGVVVIGRAPSRGGTPYDELLRPGAMRPVTEADGADGAVVVYTSGTTGKPKGAVRRFPPAAQRNVVQAVAELGLRADDRHLVVCPLYHTTAFGFVGFTFLLGGTVVLTPHFTPEETLQTIATHGITTSAMVPTMLYRLVGANAEVRARHDVRSLRAVFSAGAPLSGTLAREFIEAFGPVLYNVYGSTETGINTVATPAELLRAPGTIGHAVPGNELAILDGEGHPVPDGASGELFLRNGMLAGYHDDSAATAASMRRGFFSVGDLAHRSADGLYFIDGRKRDMLISGGVNVYPAEVEEVLARHPAVAEAAVIGVDDPEWGERVRAFVALRGDAHADEASVIEHCRRSLSGPKVPREVRFLPELPRNPTGKVLKRALRDLP